MKQGAPRAAIVRWRSGPEGAAAGIQPPWQFGPFEPLKTVPVREGGNGAAAE